MKFGITAEVLVLALALLFALPAQAQHGKPQHNGGRQQHGQQQERHVDRGHGRNEGRSIDSRYREEHFGRRYHESCGEFYGRRTFEFGGIWFGLEVWPSYWLSSDYVFVEYVDGDYFLVNERYPDARVAIIIE
jgi:hypothetical protein